MKAFCIYLIIFFTLQTVPSNGQSTVTVKYNTLDLNQPKTFTLPLEDGSFFFGNRLQIKPDENGFVKLKMNLKQPGFVYTYTMLGLLEIYVEPSKHLLLEIGETVKFKGDLKNENEFLYNRRRLYRSGHTEVEITLIKTKPTDQFMGFITDAIAREVNAMGDSVQNSDKLNPEFVKLVSIKTKLFYYSQALSAISYKQSKSKKSNSANPDSVANWTYLQKSLFDEQLIKCGLSTTNWYSDYLGGYMSYLWAEDGTKFSNEGESTKRMTRLANEYLQHKSKEAYVAHYISLYSSLGTYYYTSNMVDLFNDFKAEFPKSSAIPLLEKRIAEIRRYLFKDNSTLAGIDFLDKQRKILTFDSLIGRFSGKVILFDIWATWCGPCIEEFDQLTEIFRMDEKRKDFVILFVSRDKIKDEEKWRRFVLSKKLKGYHIIPSDSLARELRSLFNWDAIPRYAIVDEAGNIVNNNAPSPGSGNLLMELSKYLKD